LVISDLTPDFNTAIFEYDDLPNTRSAALRWYGHTAEFVPGFNVVWKRESGNPAHWHSRPSTLEAHFTWCFPSEIVDQSLDDTRLTLEHYLNWE